MSAFNLIPAVLTGEMPARWPFKPLTRGGNPLHFWATFSVLAIAGLLGTLILLHAVFRSL